MRRAARSIPIVALAFGLGCQNGPFAGWLHEEPSAPAPPPVAEIDPRVLARAESERREYLEREVARLHQDLQQAEDSIVQLESGLRGLHTRADAVSAVAEARIALDRVSRSVPWRRDRVAEARDKVEEADRQLVSDHLGSAVFFAGRAQRITESLRAETQQVAKWSDRRVIRGDRVNLRSAPSESASVVEVLAAETPLFPERSVTNWTLVRTPDGRVGWVRQSLLK
jgi:predicted RNase H-like nuclease (RuvC/YqgF family)